MGNLFEQGEKYCFSRDLTMQLSKMQEYPITIIEAPSGFGKTTAVREYLNSNLPVTARQYWYTCLGESAPACWVALCDLFKNVAPEMAAKLKDLRMPVAGAPANIALSEGEIICPADTYLVIDNYHLIAHSIILELKSLFAVLKFSRLHFIVIAQQYPEKFYTLAHDVRIYKIQAPVFFFDKAGTDALFRLEGIRLSADELDSIYANTEGWVAAIRMQILNYREAGSLTYARSIETLVETAVWNRLIWEEKEFMVSVSVLDSFTPGQAAMMIGAETLPPYIDKLLHGNAFIRFNPDTQSYIIHSILQDFLRNRFYNHYSQNFQSQIMRRAGSYFAAVENYCPAAVIYYREKDYPALLSLPVDCDYMISQKENYRPGFLEVIVESCPDKLLKAHPYKLLLYAYEMFLQERYQALAKIHGLLDAVLQKCGTLSQSELRILHGEYELHKAVCSSDRLDEKRKGCEAAWSILQKPSAMITPDMPWPYACSLLNQLWTEPGKLEQSIDFMYQYCHAFHRITDGYIYGAGSIFHAEVMLMRGNDKEAEIMCYRALAAAEEHDQTSMLLYAELLRARIGILRGNKDLFNAALTAIKKHTVSGESKKFILRTAELCLTMLGLILDKQDMITQWFCDLKSIKSVLYPASVSSTAKQLYAKKLLLEKRYPELFGALAHNADQERDCNYLMPRLQHHLHLAIAHNRVGQGDTAMEHLHMALDYALPDKVYLPFAEHMGAMLPLLRGTASAKYDQKQLNELIALCERQEDGRQKIIRALQKEDSPLTPREREIAILARERLTAQEISERLLISEATVRTVLRTIYSKLGIHSKLELADIEL
jgi:LuxR family maltose regulon positive regulatory protein